jgi:threonylcarbamoyladenosine tRNA methylthiotransferase MtaB
MLSILSQKKTRYFYEQQQGSTRPVLLEKSRQEGLLSGFTDNYVKVEIPLEESWVNHIVPAKLSHINAEGIMQITMPETVE